ncbi:iron citrate ABC transporter substrate-binding protein [Salimicrobium jeotgali]|uniref:Ferrichrome ABC transporter substrate-binding protein n=1 Tax=Salimicrobium jeotgali TaxID=1230341 RepID=K2G613_9BACI|nr:Fe(3+) dicitrate ABC transporter substrate-binding protein [Salimicrobium jeotgali]AKG05065.1 iron citrate ABC transporter substrate-binding protein [Salimicrobium jeotgali]EKE30623.1 ferrichrome ABC transporter substrate-binding protein [Salimicrobium jeotgali]MBM7696858.1 iron complex transport system substrate-binding protein [Salimicrobium jeotgali]
MKRYAVLISMFAFVIFLAACGGNEEDSSGESQEDKKETRTIKHEMGETEITGTPEKVVALEFSFVDNLASLGITPAGIADDEDPERIIDPVKEKIGDYTSVGTRKQPSLEVISSLQPDLIIADYERHQDIYDQLSEIAPTIVLPSLSADYAGIIDSFETVAKAVGKEQKGEEVLKEHKNRMEELRSQVPEDESRTVLPAVVADSGYFAHNFESYTGSLLESIGLENAIQSGDDRYNKINLEQIVEIDPDVMFHMVTGDKTVVDEWKENDLYGKVSAVKEDQVYEVDRNMWSRFRGLISSEKILEDAIDHLYE